MNQNDEFNSLTIINQMSNDRIKSCVFLPNVQVQMLRPFLGNKL